MSKICGCYDTSVCDRFEREIRNHRLKVLHNDGLYRHLKCMKPGDSSYWFEIITAPNSLTFRGDGDSYVFHRVKDMFQFFRSGWYHNKIHINTTYWAEKVTSDRACLKGYDSEVFRTYVLEQIDDDVEKSHPGLRRHLTQALENCDDWGSEYDLNDERSAREFLDNYQGPEGFGFHDVWEMDFRTYDWWFLWGLHAIVWAIKEFDKVQGDGKDHDVTEGEDITASLV